MEKLRQLMHTRPVIGTFVKLPRPEVVDVMALAGFDFIVLDYEHAQIGAAELLATVRAACAAELPVLVRVPELDRGLINRLLEAGAIGIQLARVNASSAAELDRLVRYPPAGTRSMSLAQPAGRYGLRPVEEYIATHNADVLTVGQIETRDYARALDETVAALDITFIGPMDLSVDLGHPGDVRAGAVQDAIAAIEASAARAGVPLGIFVAGRDAARTAIGRGYRYLLVSSDLGMLLASARSVIAEMTTPADAE